MSTARPVVVGVDGSHSSLAAARYAAGLAERRGVPLRLVSAFLTPFYGYGVAAGVDPYAFIDEHPQTEAETMLTETAKQLRKDFPELVDIETKIVREHPAFALIEQSRTAGVTVVGARGVGGFTEMLLGSVSAEVSSHGYGTVVVVRPPIADRIVERGPEQRPASDKPLGPVLVGFDGSPAAREALRFAVTEALQREVKLVIVNVYWSEVWHGQRHLGADPTTYAAGIAEQLLAEAAAPIQAEHPLLDIELRSVHSMSAGYSLLEASHDAALVVTGCRGLGGFAGLLLGSVSRNLVHHGHCPVAVVHPASETPDSTETSA